MKVKEAIAKIKKECSNDLPNINSDIVRIMEYLLEVNETGVLSKIDEELSPTREKKLDDIIARIKNEEPLEHIIGTGYFYCHRFCVTKDTLIPRPETEILVDLALGYLSESTYSPNKKTSIPKRIIDIGTGSGCIIISLALAVRTECELYALDRSEEAVEIASKNIKEAGLEEVIELFQSNLFSSVPEDLKFDIVIANLPYISEEEYEKLPKSVKEFEPKEALMAPNEGKEVILNLLEESEDRLKNNGVLILEMDPSQIEDVEKEAQRVFPNSKTNKSQDLSGKTRFLTVETNLQPQV